MNKFFILFILLFLCNVACDDNLDIEPQQAISTDVALSSEQGIRTALVGTYGLLISLSTFVGNEVLNSELLIDHEDLFWTSYNADLTQVLNKSIPTNSLPIEEFWINSFRIINQTNSIINALDVVNDDQLTAIERTAIEAEARFLRGMVYFDLVNLFAKTWGDGNPSINLGLPIVAIPSEQSLVNPIIPRNTVEEVYQFIVADLKYATENLLDQNGVFATNHAARAILSRVYLVQEKFNLAALEAGQVITSGTFSLLTEFPAVFNASANTPEDIFSLQYTAQSGLNNTSYFYSGELEGGGGFIGITDEHIAKYEAGDKRSTLFYLDQQNGTRRTSKWKPTISNDGNMSLARLAEMYLTRSECRFRTGDIEGATADLNVIRIRAGLPILLESEVDLEVILSERFLELVFEGHRFRDTKRTRKPIGGLLFDDPSLIYPIPKREMDVNAALIQNEGY